MKKYSLTEEHRAQLGPWADKWIANALRTDPITPEQKAEYRLAVAGLYEAAKLEQPRNVVFAAGPITGAIAASVAAGVWYLREHPEEHRKLFGRAISERELVGSIQFACEWAVTAKKPILLKRSVTYAATDAATRDATDAATDAATRDATDDATYDATTAATRAATTAATRDATRAAAYAATRAATDAATRAATDDATRDATDAATDDATRAATTAATRAATTAATRDATDAATDAATRAAAYDATRAATTAATRAATTAATRDATDDVAKFLVLCTQHWYRLWQGGSQWSGWTAYLSFFRHISKLQLDYSQWQHYEKLTEANARFMHARFCIISDRPEVLKLEGSAPHCASGPSHVWRDGMKLYHWRGTKIPAEWIEQKDRLDPRLALTHENIELRRIVAEIVGWNRVLEELKPRVIERDADPMIGTLLEVDLPGSPGERFLQVTCGTGRIFALPVPPECQTALEANAWTYGLEPSKLREMETRT